MTVTAFANYFQDPPIKTGFIKQQSGPDSNFIQGELYQMIDEHGGMDQVDRVIYENVNTGLGIHNNSIYMKDGTVIEYTEFEQRAYTDEPAIQLYKVENDRITEFYTTGDEYGDCYIDDIDDLNSCENLPEKNICST